MPQRSSSDSVRILSVDRELVVTAVERFARELIGRERGVVAVVWFGSWVHGQPTPGSDVDLCIILRDSWLSRRERTARYLPGAFPVGIDLFVYTRDEFLRLARDSPAWHRTVCAGRVVAGSLP